MADFEVHAVGTAERLRAGAPVVAVSALERDRWMARALRAEGILAAIWRRLDDYRERGQAMPSYAELVRLLQG